MVRCGDLYVVTDYALVDGLGRSVGLASSPSMTIS